jgi:hypothetical protein
MTALQLIGLSFEHIGGIELERDANGIHAEYLPQARYRDAATARIHAYGTGPFCRFRIGRKRRQAGLYVVTLDQQPVYAGECVDLEKRWGPNGYGGISPRNCFDGGQPTNCRVNAAILTTAKAGHQLDLWFAPLDCPRGDRLAAETRLIQTLRPAWNRAKLGS